MSDGQRKLLFDFLASSLGKEGYRRGAEALAAKAFLSDAWLARMWSWSAENYWISFYGAPSATSPWGWQFGGHHLALNLSVEDNGFKSMSLSFVGTEPAIFTYKGIPYEAVIDMQRAGYALYATESEIGAWRFELVIVCQRPASVLSPARRFKPSTSRNPRTHKPSASQKAPSSCGSTFTSRRTDG